MKSYVLLLFILNVIPILPKVIYIVVCFHCFTNNKIYIICKYYKPSIFKLLYLLFKPNNITNFIFLMLKYHWQ
jgi:hypothetical protein